EETAFPYFCPPVWFIVNLRQYRTILSAALRSQIFCQLVHKWCSRAVARQDIFVQDVGKYASKDALKASAVNCAVLP
ncbi:MAG: hypothetical protein RSE64_08795, partial [Oscillospiraceae bacterium]